MMVIFEQTELRSPVRNGERSGSTESKGALVLEGESI